ncbi:MAG: O-antigen ligase family protein [Patescibacteria group bacterium]|nr:O-antigen ligase family protein [Patescibacteria group bacterium]
MQNIYNKKPMGKKSREKKIKRESPGLKPDVIVSGRPAQSGLEKVLLFLATIGVYLALASPLVLQSKFFFPFVGLKSLYLMGFCELVFFSWLVLAVLSKQYRPKLNYLLIAFAFFILAMTLSSVFGVDPSRSFWSKFERMTGLLMWLHIFGFFLAISNTFKTWKDWRKIFVVSLGWSVITAFLATLELAGVKNLGMAANGSATVGNTSFLGTYLLFSGFLAFYVFWQAKNKTAKIIAAALVVYFLLVVHFAGARAATVCLIGGLALSALFWLSFMPRRKSLKIVGRVLLCLSLAAALCGLVLLFTPGSFVHNKFIDLTSRSRFVNWQIAWSGFMERPALGWGPETYDVLFPRFFNPCLFTLECGSEVWFDRTHNIVFDNLATMGVLGSLAYFGIFAALFYIVSRKYLKEKTIDFWTFVVFIILPVAYFLQNLTVFDMPVSLMMFGLALGFGGFLATDKNQPVAQKTGKLKNQWFALVALAAFAVCLAEFVVKPAMSDHFVISAIVGQDTATRMEFYKKTLADSPLGKYQIRDFFSENITKLVQDRAGDWQKDEAMKKAAQSEIGFIAGELGKSVKESPLDFRSWLKLGQAYNVYTLLDYSKKDQAETVLRTALGLSPKNQMALWALAQNRIYEGKYDEALQLAQQAIVLEPAWLQSYDIAQRIADLTGQQETARQIAKQGEEAAIARITKYPDQLSFYTFAVSFAQKAGDIAEAGEVARQAVAFNAQWAENFKDVLGTSTGGQQ